MAFFIEDGLALGEPIGRPVESLSLDRGAAHRHEHDARLRVCELEERGARAQVVFAETSGRVFEIQVDFPQEDDADGAQRQRERADALVTQLSERHGAPKRRERKKRASWRWTLDDATIELELSEHSNVAGWYCDLRVTTRCVQELDAFTGRALPVDRAGAAVPSTPAVAAYLASGEPAALPAAEEELRVLGRRGLGSLYEAIDWRAWANDSAYGAAYGDGLRALLRAADAELSLDAFAGLLRRRVSLPDDIGPRLAIWAEYGDDALRPSLVETLKDIPAARTTTAAGPTFHYGSAAQANQRLLRLRLEASYEGDEARAFAEAAKHRECTGELGALTAKLAADRGSIAYGGPLETLNELSGVLVCLASVDPARLSENLAALVNKSSLRNRAKRQLVGLLPWQHGQTADSTKEQIWVTRWHRVVLTLRASKGSDKTSFAFKVAPRLEKVAALQEKVLGALTKKLGARFAPGDPSLQDVNLPAAAELDLREAAKHANRAELLRGLGGRTLDTISPEAFPDYALFDLMNAGVRLERAPADWQRSVTEALRSLRRNVLPQQFDALCQRSWGADASAELRAHGLA